MRKLIAFPWVGGKTYHLLWLLPIIDGIRHTTYVEPYGGSAAVLLNKKPSRVEVYNDLCEDVVEFFKTLRDHRDDLLPLLDLTPYSREEFAEACKDHGEDDVERARRFYIRARQVRTGFGSVATPGRWCYGKDQSCQGKALPVARWLSGVGKLAKVAERIRHVRIESMDGIEVMRKHDSKDTLHYVDPPYLMAARSGWKVYRFEMEEKKHVELLAFLKTLKGRVVLSGYANPMYSNALKGWHEHHASPRAAPSTQQGLDSKADVKQETVWVSPGASLPRYALAASFPV